MKTLITLLLLASISTQAQSKWYKISKNDLWVMGTQSLAGGADAVNQMIIHHRFGVGKKFWDNHTSWQNKYKDWPTDKSSAYPFSKNVLAFTTDGFHLSRFVSRTSTLFTIGIVAGELKDYPKNEIWKVAVKKMLLSLIANRITFLIIYK